MSDALDISANRKAAKYGRTELLRRVLWSAALLLFRLSPRPLFGFRRFLLRLFGARVGEGVNIYGSATIYMPWHFEIGDWSSVGEHAYIYNLGPITVGKRVTISQRTHLCAGTHDYRQPDMPLIKPPIVVEDDAWICADAFVGPNVRIGQGAIVGARAVAVKDVEPWTIVAGNPARMVKMRELRKS